MPNTLIPIQTYTLSSSAASVTFSNIPQNYTDLKLVVSARGTDASYQTDCNIQVGNGSVDTGSNYTTRELSGIGSGTPSSNAFTTTNVHPPMPGSTATSNTLGNFEVYIPNYTGSTQKSMSCDVVTENNATLANVRLCSYIHTGTSAINIITLTAASGTFVANSTFTLYGISNGVKATGGTLTVAGGYAYHTFTSTGSFLPSQKITGAEILAVAGGAGGAGTLGGGGGAGGVLYASSQTLNAGNSYTALVGSGGSGGATQVAGTNGTNSILVDVSLL